MRQLISHKSSHRFGRELPNSQVKKRDSENEVMRDMMKKYYTTSPAKKTYKSQKIKLPSIHNKNSYDGISGFQGTDSDFPEDDLDQ
mmetsp:Transcript_4634/g.624  ORF Transcript_4634/g.624 Transcript_4634/m.624 type:complete len:86 (-) Transcript_4634:59-316(-)